MDRNLPEFENPPLTEVILSVQFEALERVHTPQIGLLWTHFRERFPTTEEHAPLEPAYERFGAGRPAAAELRLQMFDAPPLPRVWFVSQSGNELIQVQTDRFIHNWRKVAEDDQYPRYEKIRSTFDAELRIFQRLLADQQWGQIVPNQCEVTYINVIAVNSHSQLNDVVSVFRPKYKDCLGELEDVRLGLRFVMRGPNHDPVGRLHVSAEPVFKVADNQPAFRLTLTARSQPLGEGIEDVLRAFDQGREEIVRAFAAVTTPEMHQFWRRTDA